jgi:hypothetical protein
MRPKASEENKSIALAFAQCVTTRSDVDSDFVARHGRTALFAAFEQVCPMLTRDANDPHPANRHGISEPEFNKVVEKRDSNNFVRARNRLVQRSVTSSEADSSERLFAGAGSWMFARLRWRDPDSPHDLSELTSKLAQLNAQTSNLFDEEVVVRTVRGIRRQWVQLLPSSRSTSGSGATSHQATRANKRRKSVMREDPGSSTTTSGSGTPTAITRSQWQQHSPPAPPCHGMVQPASSSSNASGGPDDPLSNADAASSVRCAQGQAANPFQQQFRIPSAMLAGQQGGQNMSGQHHPLLLLASMAQNPGVPPPGVGSSTLGNGASSTGILQSNVPPFFAGSLNMVSHIPSQQVPLQASGMLPPAADGQQQRVQQHADTQLLLVHPGLASPRAQQQSQLLQARLQQQGGQDEHTLLSTLSSLHAAHAQFSSSLGHANLNSGPAVTLANSQSMVSQPRLLSSTGIAQGLMQMEEARAQQQQQQVDLQSMGMVPGANGGPPQAINLWSDWRMQVTFFHYFCSWRILTRVSVMLRGSYMRVNYSSAPPCQRFFFARIHTNACPF